ncbi:hypothetical protein ACQPXM_41345 (plasmid) [Kribbella sp. CA-253562]|uniref:hypothetical protein n=1 Tax=Kribbella sp. CA-253562 TaxID=3239942 RepID=UPI003D8EF483
MNPAHIQLDLFGEVAAQEAIAATAHCVVRRAGIRYERRNRDPRVADENAVLWYGKCWSKETRSEVGCWANGQLIAVYVNGKRSEEARQAELEARGGVAPA